MTRVPHLLTALLVAAAPLAAQTTRSADAQASVTIQPSLTLTKTQDISFGTFFATTGSAFTSSTIYAAWVGTSDPGNSLSISFSIPPQLVRTSGGANVPFSCGTAAGRFINGAVLHFDPATGISATGALPSPGTFEIDLGKDDGFAGPVACAVTLTGHPAGTYTGVITLTVAVL